jgi:5,10-methylenetetrahydromethanopterin reductase
MDSTPMADIGVAFDGRAPIATIGDQARLAEAGGATTLWIACHLFLRDPVTTAALALSATTRIRVALMAMSPYSVHPVFAAMAAATLDEMFPGRVTLCLGVGAPADLAAAGIAAPKPLATLSEAIALSRALLGGEPVRHRGEIFQVADRRLINGAGRVPIVLAASGPQMLELAGRAADGVLISAATSVKFVRWCLDHVERGAAGRKVATCAIVYTGVAARAADANDKLRRKVGFVLRGAHHARNLALAGTRLDQAALAAAYQAEDWAAVDRLVDDAVLRNHAASGTPDEVRAAYAAYHAIGLDEVIVGGADAPDDVRDALAALGPLKSK